MSTSQGQARIVSRGGLQTKVGLLSSLKSLSMKLVLGRCFSFLYINLGLYTTPLVCQLETASHYNDFALKAAVFGWGVCVASGMFLSFPEEWRLYLNTWSDPWKSTVQTQSQLLAWNECMQSELPKNINTAALCKSVLRKMKFVGVLRCVWQVLQLAKESLCLTFNLF